jgi:hypothetical protein
VADLVSNFPEKHRHKMLDVTDGSDIGTKLKKAAAIISARRAESGNAGNKRSVLAVCGSLFAAAEAREALYK